MLGIDHSSFARNTCTICEKSSSDFNSTDKKLISCGACKRLYCSDRCNKTHRPLCRAIQQESKASEAYSKIQTELDLFQTIQKEQTSSLQQLVADAQNGVINLELIEKLKNQTVCLNELASNSLKESSEFIRSQLHKQNPAMQNSPLYNLLIKNNLLPNTLTNTQGN